MKTLMYNCIKYFSLYTIIPCIYVLHMQVNF